MTQTRHTAGLFPLPDWQVLEVAGPDAVKFLHNLTPGNVQKLAVGEGQRNALLDRRAHVLGVFTLHRLEAERFWLIGSANAMAAIGPTLSTYKLVDRVTLSEPEVSLWALQGPKAFDKLGMILPTFGCQAFGQGWVFSRSLTGLPGAILALPKETPGFPLPPFEEAVSAAALESLRIMAGLPRFGLEFDARRMLPETGFSELLVDSAKGCFLGQEPVARLRTLGGPKRQLAQVVFKDELKLTPNTDLLADSKTVGTVLSITHSDGKTWTLAMVESAMMQAETPITLLSGETATVYPLAQKLAEGDPAWAAF